MARNLVMFDPADNEWCVVCRIGSIGDDPKTTVAFYKTQDEANEAAASLREKINIPVNIQIFQYSYAKDEMDILKLMLLDGIDIAIKYMVG
uniref:WGR domain protein n=1 Tax=Siphoviridae sp. ctcK97 TaxID=2825571 RepID=A0A8S5UB13_9CAUD|nr:MAG TPA: WGR domain protein [Siphoviridae sp. ctcK97]